MARQMGYSDVDELLSSISYKQAMEWELLANKNPLPEEKIILQIAMIGSLFANAYLKKQSRQPWKITDFIPYHEEEKEKPKNLKTQMMNIMASQGDKKAKDRLKKHDEMVKGTDGRYYKYPIEEFIKVKNRLPRRLRNKK